MKTKSKTKFAIHDLITALEAARDHLEYCGYGDFWERECAHDSKLPDQIESALRKGKQALLNEGTIRHP